MSIYNTKSVNDLIEDSTKRSKMGVGIHSNCNLESIEIAKTKANVDYMEFIFVKKEDNTFMNQRIWFPNPNPKPFDGETPEQALEREIKSKLSHVVKILKTFVSEKDAEINANSFGEFCSIAKARIEKTNFKNQPVYLKVIYDKDGVFTQFPTFPNYIQKQVEGQECRIKMSAWELENRCTPAKINEAPKGSGTINAEDDDLPF
jgi:hypothetical protein